MSDEEFGEFVKVLGKDYQELLKNVMLARKA